MYYHLAGRMATAIDALEATTNALVDITEKLKLAQQTTEEMFLSKPDDEDSPEEAMERQIFVYPETVHCGVPSFCITKRPSFCITKRAAAHLDRCSDCQKTASQSSPLQRRIKSNPFSTGACTWAKILIRLQVWNLFAIGGQIMRAADCKNLSKSPNGDFRQPAAAHLDRCFL